MQISRYKKLSKKDAIDKNTFNGIFDKQSESINIKEGVPTCCPPKTLYGAALQKTRFYMYR
jgi:hypothetical protein